ncbi:MAG TPA: hypothetical protein VJL28_04955 [Gemmatimonadaceae bacterium]|nr:hypothetical protein [Gemmatimonadaceae bacterium]
MSDAARRRGGFGRAGRYVSLALALIASTLLTSTLVASGAGAQDAAQIRARTLAASRHALAMRARYDSARRAARAVLPSDSIRAGGLTLRVDPEVVRGTTRRTIERAAARASEEIRRTLGSAADDLTIGNPVVVRGLPAYALTWRGSRLAFGLAGVPGRASMYALTLSEHEATRTILDLVGSLAASRAPDSLRAWTYGWIPAFREEESRWADFAVELAVSRSFVARACHRGALGQCERALGLVPVHDKLTEWYAPEDWRALLDSWKPLDPDVEAVRRDCVEKGVPASCERAARARTVPLPLTMAARQSLLGLALERGGTDAYRRLLAARGGVREVLAATAGIGADSLVAEWRARVLAASPHGTRPGAAEAGFALAWVVLLSVAAARRRP